MKPIEILKELLNEEPFVDELPEDWEIASSGEWTDGGKFEMLEDVVRFKPTGQLFCVNFSRHGDYWQGYETELDSVVEVEAYQKTITAYREVNPFDAIEPVKPGVAKAVASE